jgi:hypothetical protein
VIAIAPLLLRWSARRNWFRPGPPIAESSYRRNIPGMFCGVAVALCGGDWHL